MPLSLLPPALLLPLPLKRALQLLKLPLLLIPNLALLLLDLLLSSRLVDRLVEREDGYAPHGWAGFEGWYTRVLLDPEEVDGSQGQARNGEVNGRYAAGEGGEDGDGRRGDGRGKVEGGERGSIILIVCQVRGVPASQGGHYVHFSYHPPSSSSNHSIRSKQQRSQPGLERVAFDLFPRDIHESVSPLDPQTGVQQFKLSAEGVCEFSRTAEGIEAYVHLPGALYVKIKVEDVGACRAGKGAEGVWSWLGEVMPLHWEVGSREGRAEVEIWRTRVDDEEEDETEEEELWDGEVQGRRQKVGRVLSATGRAHCEKNWGISFPRGWVWAQATTRPPRTLNGKEKPSSGASFVLAGGKILGQRAHLILFRSPETGRNWAFRPPWTIRLFGLGIMEERVNKQGELRLDVRDGRRRLVIHIKAQEPTDKWLPLYCPLPQGHRVFASETFTATAKVDVFERRGGGWWSPWSGRWELVERREFEDVAFELGGDYR